MYLNIFPNLNFFNLLYNLKIIVILIQITWSFWLVTGDMIEEFACGELLELELLFKSI